MSVALFAGATISLCRQIARPSSHQFTAMVLSAGIPVAMGLGVIAFAAVLRGLKPGVMPLGAAVSYAGLGAIFLLAGAHGSLSSRLSIRQEAESATSNS